MLASLYESEARGGRARRTPQRAGKGGNHEAIPKQAVDEGGKGARERGTPAVIEVKYG